MVHKSTTAQSCLNNPQQPTEGVRACEWDDCEGASEGACEGLGEFRAPLSPDDLNSYRWYCLVHIRKYNKSWNYYDGMNDAQVEADRRRDTVWRRPSWKLGMNAASLDPDHTIDPFEILGERNDTRNPTSYPVRPPISKEEEKAYKTLDIEYPASARDIKARYKELVKKHHPDANKGSKKSEEKIKKINQAYQLLQNSINSVKLSENA